MNQNTGLGVQSMAESEFITKQLLETAIRTYTRRDNVNVNLFTVKTGRHKGENYSSVVFTVTADVEEDTKSTVYDFFIKIVPNNKLLKQYILNKCKYFSKEEMAYREIIRDMVQYQIENEMKPIESSVPGYFFSVVDESTGILILENLRPLGYVLPDRKAGLSFKECEIVLKNLAMFHALSFMLKRNDPQNLKKYEYLFYDSVFPTSVPFFKMKILNASVQLIKTLTNDLGVRERVDKMTSLDLKTTVRELLTPVESYAVICHGDLWCDNLLFKYDSQGSKENIEDVKLLDLQLVRYALPTTDLSYFFFTSTTREMRKKHLYDLLYIYYITFQDSLRKTNIDFPEFTFDVLKSLFTQSALFGLLFSCMYLPRMLLATEKIAADSEAELEQFANQFCTRCLALAEQPENMTFLTERLLGAAEDGVEMGIL